MSLTPIDEGQKTQSTLTRGETGPQSRRERILAGLTAFVKALPFGRKLVSAISSDEDTDDARHETSRSPARPEDDPLPERSIPISHPSQSRSTAGIDLVGEQDGETLTIMFPDRPETSITSDVFEEIEP